MTTPRHWIEYRSTLETSHPIAALSVRRLLRSTVLGPEKQHLGHVRDVVAHPDEGPHLAIAGAVALLGTCEVYLPVTVLACWQPGRVQLVGAGQLRGFVRRDEDLLLGADLLGQRLITSLHRHPRRAHDLLLARSSDGWHLAGVDVRGRMRRWFRPVQYEGLLDWKAVRGVQHAALRPCRRIRYRPSLAGDQRPGHHTTIGLMNAAVRSRRTSYEVDSRRRDSAGATRHQRSSISAKSFEGGAAAARN